MPKPEPTTAADRSPNVAAQAAKKKSHPRENDRLGLGPSSQPKRAEDSVVDPIEAFVLEKIAEAQSALWRAELTRRVMTLVIATLAAVFAWVVIDQWIGAPGKAIRLVYAVGGLTAAAVYLATRVWPVFQMQVRPEYAARALERDNPELGHSLSSYFSLRRQHAGISGTRGDSPRLSDRVVQSIGLGTAVKLKKVDATPREATGLERWWAAAIGMVALIAIYAVISPKNSLQSVNRLVQPLASIDAPKRVRISDVAPGNIETLAGREVDFAATVKGLRDGEPTQLIWNRPDAKTQAEGKSAAASVPANSGTPRPQPAAQTPGSGGKSAVSLTPDPDDSPDRYTATVPISHQSGGV